MALLGCREAQRPREKDTGGVTAEAHTADPPPAAGDSTQPSVSLRNVVKRFGDLTAVKGLDLDIAAGEFFTLLGPSGCG